MRLNAKPRRIHLLAVAAATCAGLLAGCAEPNLNEIPTPQARPSSTRGAADYVITDLGGFSSRGANAMAINELGHVAGTAVTTSGRRHAILWADGQTTDLGTLGGPMSRARGLNDRDEVVGESLTSSGDQHAFFWSPSGGARDLGGVPGANAFATGINNRGDIVGGTNTPDGPGDALWWPAGGALQDLGSFGAPGQTELLAINQSGHGLLGVNFGVCNYTRAYVWSASGDLTPIPAADSPATDPCGGTSPIALTDAGTVVGSAAMPTGNGDEYQGYPYVWRSGASALELLAGNTPGQARAINNRGVIVGFVNPTGPMQAFVWTSAAGLVLLPTDPAWNGDAMATGINNAGVIVGWAQVDGVQHAIMWTPVNKL